jgi:hypothetical protein
LEGALTSASGLGSHAEITTCLDTNQPKVDLKGDINTYA